MQNLKISGSRKLELDTTSDSLPRSKQRWLRGKDFALCIDHVDGFEWTESTVTICFSNHTLSFADPDRKVIDYLRNLVVSSVVHEIP